MPLLYRHLTLITVFIGLSSALAQTKIKSAEIIQWKNIGISKDRVQVVFTGRTKPNAQLSIGANKIFRIKDGEVAPIDIIQNKITDETIIADQKGDFTWPMDLPVGQLQIPIKVIDPNSSQKSSVQINLTVTPNSIEVSGLKKPLPGMTNADTREAFMVEGNLGVTESSVGPLTAGAPKIQGDLSSLRVHLPLKQTKNQIFALTLSNQYFDGVKKKTPDEAHVLSYSALGAGFSYRYRFLLAGMDYQMMDARQSVVGTAYDLKNYSVPIMNLYGGFLVRFGSMGAGISVYSKSGDLPKGNTGKKYEETGTVLNLTYHWEGTSANFFKSLYSR